MAKALLRKLKRKIRNYFAGDLFKYVSVETGLPVDFNQFAISTIQKVQPFTMTSPERIAAFISAVQYIVQHKIEGAIVECGVWKGGSMMAAAYALLEQECNNRDLYLFDTFAGMSEASALDVACNGVNARNYMQTTAKSTEDYLWAYAPLEEVRTALFSTGYPKEKFHFIPGKVENTIPDQAPDKISILRLDTDWYESTKHELIYLFPRLVAGGVLIIDDYGHWQGAKKAVDEYIAEHKIKILLNRIDYTGRIAIKQ